MRRRGIPCVDELEVMKRSKANERAKNMLRESCDTLNFDATDNRYVLSKYISCPVTNSKKIVSRLSNLRSCEASRETIDATMQD